MAGSIHVHRVNDTGNPTQDGQTDVDQEIRAATTLQEDTQRGQDDGEDDLADVTGKGWLDGRRETGEREGVTRKLTKQ